MERLKRYKADRDQTARNGRMTTWRAPRKAKDENVFERIVDAACAGVTHGEICPG